MQEYCDVYKWTILKRTSPEVKCLHPTSSWREMCTSSVSNVIYHKFSHGPAFYTLNGKNVNVMLESFLTVFQLYQDDRSRSHVLYLFGYKMELSPLLNGPNYLNQSFKIPSKPVLNILNLSKRWIWKFWIVLDRTKTCVISKEIR